MRKTRATTIATLAAIAVTFGGMAPASSAATTPAAATVVAPTHDPGTDRWWHSRPAIKSVDVSSRYKLGVNSLGKSSRYSNHLHTVYLGEWSAESHRLDWACARKSSTYTYKTYTRSETRTNRLGMTSWSRLWSGCRFIGNYGQVKTYRDKF